MGTNIDIVGGGVQRNIASVNVIENQPVTGDADIKPGLLPVFTKKIFIRSGGVISGNILI